MMTNLK